ncbi:MAG TPA: SRPBCC domain-containing protein [Bacteroidia bacterium]|nr:SRPBCC domain-containing protein [Bacteroidia bacterium]
MKNKITHTWFFNHKPEQVWEYLTKAELITQWLMPNDFQPVKGHKFMFTTRPLPQFNFDGKAYCEVLEITPFTKLTYTWKGGDGNGKITLDSVVYWVLVPKDNGTQLSLEHTGFNTDLNLPMFNAMNAGWDMNVKKIIGFLDNK